MFHLKEGDAAPAFSASNEKGQTIQLADFQGKKLVLYFYPKDDTPGCTAQACSLRDSYGAFQAKGYEILGVSPDSVKKHVKFQEKFSLPFALLAELVRVAFSQRRKLLRHTLGAWLQEKQFSGDFDVQRRAEEVPVDEYVALAQTLAP